MVNRFHRELACSTGHEWEAHTLVIPISIPQTPARVKNHESSFIRAILSLLKMKDIVMRPEDVIRRDGYELSEQRLNLMEEHNRVTRQLVIRFWEQDGIGDGNLVLGTVRLRMVVRGQVALELVEQGHGLVGIRDPGGRACQSCLFIPISSAVAG